MEASVETTCVFCAIVAGKSAAEIVYEDAETMAFLDIHPSAPGHTLVIPRRHYRNLFDISTESGLAVMRTVILVAQAVRAAFQPDGMNLIQSNERAGFQSVYHFHMHIVPRWFGDGILSPWRPRPVDGAALRQAGERIRKAMSLG